jgi:hypothetical protein
LEGLVPKGPRGEKRPADVIGAAIMAAKIATGELEENIEPRNESAAAKLASKGGKARAAALTRKKRRDIAKKGAATRWNR